MTGDQTPKYQRKGAPDPVDWMEQHHPERSPKNVLWEELLPPEKAKKKDIPVRFGTTRISGQPRGTLLLKGDVYETLKLKEPDCRVHVGSGAALGKLIVIPDEHGPFRWREIGRNADGHGGGTFRLLLPEVPAWHGHHMRCCKVPFKLVDATHGMRSILVDLPKALWKAEKAGKAAA